MLRALLLFPLLIGVAIRATAQNLYELGYIADTIVQTSSVATKADGGAALVGLRRAPGPVYAALVSTDAQGAVQWGRRFGPVGLFDAPTVVALSSGDLLTLSCSPVGGRLQVIRWNAAGDTLWTKGFSHGNIVNTQNALELPGGDLIIVSSSMSRYYLMRITAQGDVVWSLGFSQQLTGNASGVRSRTRVILDSNNELVACCGLNNGAADADALLLKVDLNGNLLWSKLFSTSAPEHFRDLLNTPDGGYLLVGYQNVLASTPFVMRTDVNGTPLWTRALAPGSGHHLFFARTTPTGHYVLGGQEVDGLVEHGMIVHMTDDGTVLSATRHGEHLVFRDAAVGNSASFIAAEVRTNVPHASLMAIAADSISGGTCNEIDIALAPTDLVFTEITTVGTYPSTTPMAVTIDVQDLPFTALAPCGTTVVEGVRNVPSITVHPNPAEQGRTVVEVPEGTGHLAVFDAQGRCALQLRVSGSHSVPIEGLAPGQYAVRAVNSRGSVATVKVVVH